MVWGNWEREEERRMQIKDLTTFVLRKNNNKRYGIILYVIYSMKKPLR
jgi:hypothetical protein